MDTQTLMASLASAASYEVMQADLSSVTERITVDMVTRKITTDNSKFGNDHDHLAKTKVLDITRYVGDMDLATQTAVLHWENGTNGGVYALTEVDLSEDGRMLYKWPLSEEFTQNVGAITFAVHLYTIKTGVLLYHISSDPYDGKIGKTFSATDHALETTPPSQIEECIQQMADLSAEIDAKVAAAEAAATRAEEAAANFEVDDTLSVAGKAADAAATGAKLSQLSSENAELKEDLSNKITKFYASNQGETHITDSDNGKIQDMMIYGRSSQFTTTGKNLANGQNIKCFINSITDISGVTDNDTGMAIDVSKLTNVTISTRSIQDRYRAGCANTVPTSTNMVTCYNGRNKDGTKDSYTIDTTGYNYLIVNAIKLEDIQVEKGSEATSYEPYTGGIPSPSPDYPQEIKSVVNPTVKVSNEDGTKSQTVTLPYTLNAIPVLSGGNVTIDGKQYIADYVYVERGKIVQMVQREKLMNIVEVSITNAAYDEYIFDYADSTKFRSDIVGITNIANFDDISGSNNNVPRGVFAVTWGKIYLRVSKMALPQTIEDMRKWLNNNDLYCILLLTSPIEIDLTTEEITAFKALATYYPTTNISVNSEQLDGYTVFNYPISMQNGWNYVKQQLNDNRDYIYDMDLQSAEAYVNSEYAVALTELEV